MQPLGDVSVDFFEYFDGSADTAPEGAPRQPSDGAPPVADASASQHARSPPLPSACSGKGEEGGERLKPWQNECGV
jgi:hypothetical protein